MGEAMIRSRDPIIAMTGSVHRQAAVGLERQSKNPLGIERAFAKEQTQHIVGRVGLQVQDQVQELATLPACGKAPALPTPDKAILPPSLAVWVERLALPRSD